VIDEAARVEDELLAAVRPMMATSEGGGRLIALTTRRANGAGFSRAWTGAENWTRIRVTAEDCPRISKEFLAEELRELGAQRLVIDETGVGRAVGDIFVESGLKPVRISITAGKEVTAQGGNRWHVATVGKHPPANANTLEQPRFRIFDLVYLLETQ
jgi:hypothetical protein